MDGRMIMTVKDTYKMSWTLHIVAVEPEGLSVRALMHNYDYMQKPKCTITVREVAK